MRIVVWGGLGRIGNCIFSKLQGQDVHILDKHNLHEKEELLGSTDVLINCLPYTMNAEVIAWIIRNPVHYLDLSEDTEHVRGYDWSRYPKKFVPHCGLAPGLINIRAATMMSAFDEVHECRMRVGALPRVTTNRFRYHCTWSPDGLVNEYRKPCRVIHNGHAQWVPPLDDPETIVIDGVEYEAFNTSGGIGTMVDTYADGVWGVEQMDYKSIRYPGHLEAVREMRDDLEAFREVADDGYVGDDVVLAAVVVTGLSKGKLRSAHWFSRIYGDGTHSAIQLATAEGALVALRAAMGSPRIGLIRQEELPVEG